MSNEQGPMNWPKSITTWQEGDTEYWSVPFTWLLPEARRRLFQKDLFARRRIVGGPAVKLMPDYLAGVDAEISTGDLAGVLQRVNPLATRSTVGCPRACEFCGVGRRLLAPAFRELTTWPNLPVICDDNLLAAGLPHFDRVIEALAHGWKWADFQAIDARLLTRHHAEALATLPRAVLRLALDGPGRRDIWLDAVQRLRSAGIPKKRIRSYVLIGFQDDPPTAYSRCDFVAAHAGNVLPMWCHALDCLEYGQVTEAQRGNGWTAAKQRQLMGWFYRRRGPRPPTPNP